MEERIELTALEDAAAEAERACREKKEIPFTEVEDIAERYDVLTGTLLIRLSWYPDLKVDYGQGKVICR